MNGELLQELEMERCTLPRWRGEEKSLEASVDDVFIYCACSFNEYGSYNGEDGTVVSCECSSGEKNIFKNSACAPLSC